MVVYIQCFLFYTPILILKILNIVLVKNVIDVDFEWVKLVELDLNIKIYRHIITKVLKRT